jgi:gliding motility-associated-like protein
LKFTFLAGFLSVVLWLIIVPAQAQENSNFTPLQFVENKGQWEGDFLYKTDLGGGAIFLKKNGFTFYLLNKDDYSRLTEYIHGHAEATKPPSVDYDAKKATGVPAATNPSGTNAGEVPGFSKPEKPVVRAHAYEVSFLNASPQPQIMPDKPVEGYSNYIIGNDSTKWKSNVRSYQRVMYKELYAGIDMQVYSEASQLKYDLIVHPGADPSDIQMQYNGATRLQIKKEQLEVTTSVGTTTELMPYAYQYINNQRVPVKVSYRLNGSRVSFKVSGSYDAQYPLVIDPQYVFSTVSGSRADNWGFTATYDAQGSLYGGGIVWAQGYPVTTGAVQNAFQGGQFDIGISKYTPNGRNQVYATYIGGNGDEQPHSLFADAAGNLVISGRTTSGNFPFTTVEGTRGGWDIAIFKLNATGTGRIGSICVAGGSDDGVNMRENRQAGSWILLRNYGDDARSEVVLDGAGNVFVASCTRSSDFPASAGAFQGQGRFGGAQDGVVMRLNPDCTALVWASYIGGSKEDAAYVLALNGNTLFVAGGTASSDFRTTAGVVYGAYRGGICDGFIAQISADGNTLLRSTYMGADNVAADQIYGIQLDSRGFVYIMGTTEGRWPVVQPPGTGTFYNDNSKQFIAKLRPDLSAFVYSTTFGKQASDPSLSPTAFLVDRCENVYVSGWGGGINRSLRYPNSGTSGLITKAQLQRTTDDQDFYFFVLQRDATDVLFASFFGGNGLYEHVDGGTSRFDRNGVIYQAICAWCNVSASTQAKPRYPTTPGAYATASPPFCNLGSLKIAFNLDGVKAGVKTLDRKRNYCVPATITFVDTTGIPAQTWTWNFGDGSPEVSGALDTVTHTYSAIGDYTVRLIKCDPASCNGCDTAYTEVRIRADEAQVGITATRQQPCEELRYIFENTSVPPDGKPFTRTSFLLDLGDGTPPDTVGMADFPYAHRFQQDGIYRVMLTLIDTNYCNAPHTDTLVLRVAANVIASFVAPDSSCAPSTIEFDNTTLGGESFVWDFGDGSPTSDEAYPVHTYQNPGTYSVSLQVVDNNTCNIRDDTTITIQVFGPPSAAFSFTPTKPVENTPTTFVNQTIGAIRYLWEFGDGVVSDETNPVHQYNRSGTYDVCLLATNAAGCTDTVCQQVAAIVIPLFDVPNAFSPNGDGMNDVLTVRGFGIAKFNFKIFNRWGQLVFESNDPNIGWDGRFKGAVQPMDAYAYAVTVEFSDGTTANKTGNITLLR